MLHLFRPVKIWWHILALRVTTLPFDICVGFFQNDDNQVNIGDPIEDIMISEYHTMHHTCMYMEKILPRRMSTTACSFASHFGQEMAQNADFPISLSCKNFSGVIPPNPRPVLGHRAVLFPDSRCFGSHNFQIVPARLFVDRCVWQVTI